MIAADPFARKELLESSEAATLGVAVHRGLSVATDDRRALRYIEKCRLGLVAETTSGLIRRWARTTRAPGSTQTKLLKHVRDNANFEPSRSDPNHDWWMRFLQGDWSERTALQVMRVIHLCDARDPLRSLRLSACTNPPRRRPPSSLSWRRRAVRPHALPGDLVPVETPPGRHRPLEGRRQV